MSKSLPQQTPDPKSTAKSDVKGDAEAQPAVRKPAVPKPSRSGGKQQAASGKSKPVVSKPTSGAKRKSTTKPPAPPSPPKPRPQSKRPPRPSFVKQSERDESQSSAEQAKRSMRKFGPGLLASLVFHLVLFILLALLFVRIPPNEVLGVIGTASDGDEGRLEELSLSPETKVTLPVDSEGFDSMRPDIRPGALTQQPTTNQATESQSSLPVTTQLIGVAVNRPSGLPVGGGYEGRSPEQRSELASRRGATEESEAAVELGLAWLAAHQRPNGAWWFNHHDGPCDGRCGQPGDSGCSTAATGLALLAFLGAGYTAEVGPYQKEVRDGIYYLISQARINQYGADLQQGSMYGHGIATLALCEAYSMTGDQAIRPIAQKAIDFICNAQHKAGGWRYTPKQPGDTTVFGWQYMALKSAKMARLSVPTPTVHLAKFYLDSVQTDQGAYYGYVSPGKEEGPTAIALLCRMYMGWRQQHEQLEQGVAYLAELGPSKTDLYFDYYATQVLHHYGEPHWDEWNESMRDHLVATQAKRGHERGSWYFKDEHGDEGGRLYNTAMAIMILEVYYRYMPLYEERVVGGDW